MAKRKTKKSKNIRVALRVNGRKTKAREIPSKDWLVTQRGVESKKEIVFSGIRGMFTGMVVYLENVEVFIEASRKKEIEKGDRVIVPARGLRMKWGKFIVKKTKK